ncbi:DNA repair protein RecO [Algibacillus agarilyticus]|uniref:DNA repair protein RecO n=1 Tax=Algibacillus agarilyticus TaxID=2234133 RepID=UPI000DD05AC8|nr:DNA repair protein RecO [Algibacillus agarilyticus]
MAEQNVFQMAFVLHVKPFRESSLICDLLTQFDGRVSVMAYKQKFTNPYQVFTPLVVKLKPGQGDLYFIDKLDHVGNTLPLKTSRLYSAYYVNELIVKLLSRINDSEYFFERYTQTINDLAGTSDIEPCLRQFEMTLLDEMGVWPDLTSETENGHGVQDEATYHVNPELGVMPAWDKHVKAYTGRTLKAIQGADWHDKTTLQTAKLLLRELINFHLGGQILKSRQFFKSMNKY